MVKSRAVAIDQEVTMKTSLLPGLAALAIAALAWPASAQPGTLSTRIVGHAQTGLGHYGDVGRPFPTVQGDRHRRFGGFRGGYGLIGWGNGLYEDPESLRDAGFFAGPAEAYSDGNRVHYDYDRGYPYDWYRENSARTALPIARASGAAQRQVRCGVENAGVRVCRGTR
jgi:hypothetical protein